MVDKVPIAPKREKWSSLSELTDTPRHEKFFRGEHLVYTTRRELIVDPLNVYLTLVHAGQGARDSAHNFSATINASYGENDRVVWTSKRSPTGPHTLSKEQGFGDFFPYLCGKAAEHIYELLAQGRFPQHELTACMYNLEAQVIDDFCVSTSTRLKEEVSEGKDF